MLIKSSSTNKKKPGYQPGSQTKTDTIFPMANQRNILKTEISSDFLKTLKIISHKDNLITDLPRLGTLCDLFQAKHAAQLKWWQWRQRSELKKLRDRLIIEMYDRFASKSVIPATSIPVLRTNYKKHLSCRHQHCATLTPQPSF